MLVLDHVQQVPSRANLAGGEDKLCNRLGSTQSSSAELRVINRPTPEMPLTLLMDGTYATLYMKLALISQPPSIDIGMFSPPAAPMAHFTSR